MSDISTHNDPVDHNRTVPGLLSNAASPTPNDRLARLLAKIRVLAVVLRRFAGRRFAGSNLRSLPVATK